MAERRPETEDGVNAGTRDNTYVVIIKLTTRWALQPPTSMRSIRQFRTSWRRESDLLLV